MAQVKFGNCLSETLPRKDMQRGFVGRVTSEFMPRCLPDKLLPKKSFGSGSPVVENARYDALGVPTSTAASSVSSVMTQQGALQLRDVPDTLQFVPTATDLDFLTSGEQDTRRLPAPLRYF